MCQFSRTHFSFLGTLVHIWEERKFHQSSWTRRRRAVGSSTVSGVVSEGKRCHPWGSGEPQVRIVAEPAVLYWSQNPDLFSVLLSLLCAQGRWHPVGFDQWTTPVGYQRVGQKEVGSSPTCPWSAVAMSPAVSTACLTFWWGVIIFPVATGVPDWPPNLRKPL